MKFRLIVFAFLTSTINAQNIIPDPGFEVYQASQNLGAGTWTTVCDYGKSQCCYEFDGDMEIWKVAIHENNKEVMSPDLINDGIGCYHMQNQFCYATIGITPKGTHAYIEARFNHKNNCDQNAEDDDPSHTQRYHDAIRTNFINGASLLNNTTYMLRYKVRALRASIEPGMFEGSYEELYNPMFANCTTEVDNCHMRVHLTTNGIGWNENVSYNDKLNDIGNVIRTFNPSNCEWEYIEHFVNIPGTGTYNNLIFYMETGAFAIDDVEMFPICTSNYYVQNKEYFGFIAIENGGVYREKVSSSIYAGKNIGAYNVPQGDVAIKPDATVIFTAGDQISLMDGFHVESGAEFTAVIDNCPNTRSLSSSYSGEENFNTSSAQYTEPQNDKNISLHPNPSDGYFSLSIRSESNINSNLYMVDLFGRIIHSELLTIKEGSNQFNLSLELPPGIYFIKMEGFNDSIRAIITN